MNDDKEVVIKTSVPADKHRKLKAALAMRGITIADWVRQEVDKVVGEHETK
jgi:hypothetical protein